MSLFARALFFSYRRLIKVTFCGLFFFFFFLIFETNSTVERLAPRRGALTDCVPCCSVSGASRAHREGRPTLRAAPPPQTNAQTCPPTQTARPSADPRTDLAAPGRTSARYRVSLDRSGSARLGSVRLGSGVREKLRETFAWIQKLTPLVSP